MKKQEPIRILQCVSNMDRAGIETMLMNFYRNIDRNKVQFDFLCNKSKIGDYDEEIKSMGGNIYISPGLNPFKWYRYQKFMSNLFNQHPEYKIIHCQNETMGFPALYAAKKNNIPVRIAHSHNTTLDLDFKWPIKMYYRKKIKKVATELVACSEAAGKFLFRKSVKLIHNAIDTNRFTYNEELRNKLRKQMNINGKFVIGHVGRFEIQKNHEFLIKIFAKYHEIDKNSILLLIGEGSLKNKMLELVNALGINDSVIFTGNISNVNEMYQIMDVFILPSFHEGLPVVGVEAQVNGLDCIFSDNITREIKLKDNVTFIPITEGEKKWVESIYNYKIENKRNLNNKNIFDLGYNIKDGAQKLEQWYLELYNKAGE